MGIDVANGPVSWGVDLPDKPGAPPWEEVFDEISQAGYRLCELGPMGYLPADDGLVRAELDARGLGVAGSYIFEPMHDRSRHEAIADVTERTCSRIAALGGKYLVVIDMVSDERGATAGRSAAARRLRGADYQVLLTGIRQASGIALEHGLTTPPHRDGASHRYIHSQSISEPSHRHGAYHRLSPFHHARGRSSSSYACPTPLRARARSVASARTRRPRCVISRGECTGRPIRRAVGE